MYTSPDLSDVVEEVTNRSGWCGGNSLTLLVSGSSAKKLLASYETSNAAAPELDIQYDVSTVPTSTCYTQSKEIPITSSKDDVEQVGSTLYRYDNQLQIGQNANVSQTVGLRFRNVRLIPNAAIESAYLEFTADGNTPTLPASLSIGVVNRSNPGEFSSSNKPADSPLLDSQSWNVNFGWDNDGSTYKSPDISELLEKVSKLSGWQAGNSVSFIIQGTGQLNAWTSDNSSLGPKLVINATKENFVPERTVRDEVKDVVKNINASGGTPSVRTLYEAARYFRGDKEQENADYYSPITESCQKTLYCIFVRRRG